MSLSYLGMMPSTRAPKLIMRDLTMLVESSSNMTRPFKVLKAFDPSYVRVTEASGLSAPPTQEEYEYIHDAPGNVSKSMLYSMLFMLASSVDYTRNNRAIIITRQSREVIDPMVAGMSKFFPGTNRLTFEVVCSEEVDSIELYASRKPDINTILLSLGTTVENHSKYVKLYRPNYLLAGVKVSAIKHGYFRAYDGELIFPPFSPASLQVLYLKAALGPNEWIMNPEVNGAIYDIEVLRGAIDRFVYVTNENTAFINPVTQADTYIFGHPNDYSHMFVLYAIYILFERLSTITLSTLSKAFTYAMSM